VYHKRQVDVNYAKLQSSIPPLQGPQKLIGFQKKCPGRAAFGTPGQTLFSIVNDNSTYITANFAKFKLDKKSTTDKSGN